ncbi:hypothetical protein [Streptomyces umbrinus]|uniref:hypothetical protein n=1 Tax=Streptomyces umbrinus TaxID=67370 RepID=UPI0034374402
MSLTTYLSIVRTRLAGKLQTFAATEPVRLRAALTSLALAGAVAFPALNAGTAETFGAIGVVALPLIVGESTRTKVTPAK